MYEAILYFSDGKFTIGYEKNMSFLVIPKSSKFFKKLKQSHLDLLESSVKLLNIHSHFPNQWTMHSLL